MRVEGSLLEERRCKLGSQATRDLGNLAGGGMGVATQAPTMTPATVWGVYVGIHNGDTQHTQQGTPYRKKSWQTSVSVLFP